MIQPHPNQTAPTSAAATAKAAGLKSLNQAAEMAGLTTECLRNWHKHHPQRFEIVVLGCVQKLRESAI